MATEILKIDASWTEEFTKTSEQILMTPSVIQLRHKNENNTHSEVWQVEYLTMEMAHKHRIVNIEDISTR